MAALFARREIIPEIYGPPVRGYAAIRAYARTHPGHRMRILAPDGSEMGTTETTYSLRPNGDCHIWSTATITFKQPSLFSLGLGSRKITRKIHLELWSDVTVGPDNALKEFRIVCNTGIFSGFAHGTVSGNVLKVKRNISGVQAEATLPLSKGDMVASGFMAVGALPNLRTGQTWHLKMFDPLTLEPAEGSAEGKKKPRIYLRGKSRRGRWYNVYQVEFSHGPATVTAWVTESGEVLKEEAFGMVMIRDPLPHEVTGERHNAGTAKTP